MVICLEFRHALGKWAEEFQFRSSSFFLIVSLLLDSHCTRGGGERMEYLVRGDEGPSIARAEFVI